MSASVPRQRPSHLRDGAKGQDVSNVQVSGCRAQPTFIQTKRTLNPVAGGAVEGASFRAASAPWPPHEALRGLVRYLDSVRGRISNCSTLGSAERLPSHNDTMTFRFRAVRGQALALACALATPVIQAASVVWCPAGDAPASVVDVLARDAQRRSTDEPRAIARIHTEGTLPHQGIWDASVEARRDLPLMRELALLWHVRRDRTALEHLDRLLLAWSTVYVPSFNPIDETEFDALIDAYAIAAADLPEATRAKASALLRAWATGYLNQMRHPAQPGKGTWINNWQSHRVKLATLAAAALDDVQLVDAAREQFRAQVARNLHADGGSIDFQERDALHYTVYDLEPLARAAVAARARGEDWLAWRADSGASLAAGLDWLLPYASGQRQHEEYVHTTVKFDLQRRAAGVAGFSGAWDPASSATLYWLSSQLSPRYQPVAASLGQQPAWMIVCWGGRS